MDSTFLGVMAGFSLRLRAGGGKTAPTVRLLNPNRRILESLDTMGLSALFETVSGIVPTAQYTAAPAAPRPDRVELTQTSLEAHQTLMNLSEANIPRFKDVARFLAEDLEKLGHKPKDTSNLS